MGRMSLARTDGGPFEPAGVVWQPVSPRLATARLATAAITLGVPLLLLVGVAVVTGAGWAWGAAAVPALLLAWCVAVVPRQVRAMGYAERADDLLIRKGIVFRSMVVV